MSECCISGGPGYKSPLIAMSAPKEKILYTVMIHCSRMNEKEPDCLATIDVDPASSTYTKIIHLLKMTHIGDELHHFGWNACSSCCDDPNKVRRFLVLTGLKSSRIYIVDTEEPKEPKIFKTIEPETIKEKADLSSPHTVHCLANGNIMISFLGDADGNSPGGFLILNENFEIISKYGEADSKNLVSFSYDFWYQPYHNVMVSSEWCAPKTFFNGFNPSDLSEKKYGQSIYFWNWLEEKMFKKVDFGPEGLLPLELRFHHNPKSSHGFVGAALSSSIWHFWKPTGGNDWKIEKIIQVEPISLEKSPNPVPGLITDIIISMDDKFLYFSNWLHGDIRQYDITDPSNPKLVGQVWCGGQIGREVFHKGKKLAAGPQMLQLSLDGKRLYVTNSLFSTWDDQFYPELKDAGTVMLKINSDTEKGGLSIDETFSVDFGAIENGPFRAHEMRYPGGDCSSDIWIN